MKTLIRIGAGMLILAAVLIAITSTFMSAHAATTGDGVQENRSIQAGVVNIVMNGPIDLTLRQAATPDIQVRGEAAMAARVTTRVEGNTLYIGTKGVFMVLRQPLRVELALPGFEKLQMLGSGDGNVSGFRGNRAEFSMRGSGNLNFDGDYQQVVVNMSGSGDLKLGLASSDTVDVSIMGSGQAWLKGQAKSLTVKLTGSGDLDASALKAGQVVVQSMGSADAKIYASQDARVSTFGSGDIRVYGNPGKRSAEHRGSGDISWQ
ncbi:head GIN domain-containing protein [Undibacterium sp. TJN25]|uniref:head GIN domain-containing protein n=1 Tax=Undibacterium sp. TJN25 TaxID=3413056 RepID=UPI003BEFC3AB